jgi:hypothetical protein
MSENGEGERVVARRTRRARRDGEEFRGMLGWTLLAVGRETMGRENGFKDMLLGRCRLSAIPRVRQGRTSESKDGSWRIRS